MRKTQLSQQHFSHISNTLSARLCSPPEKSLSAGDPLSGQLLRCSAFAPPALSLLSTRPPLSLRRKTPLSHKYRPTLTVVLSDSCGEKGKQIKTLKSIEHHYIGNKSRIYMNP